MKQYDVIVIGSGLGGLVSALILAKEGKSVCILEKNNQYGGNLQTFVRDKTIFDTGVHYIGGLDEGENLYKYFSYLEILDDLKLSKLDENGFDLISFSNENISYPHAQGYENFVNQLLVHFPNEEKALCLYVKKLQEVCNSFPLYNLENRFGYDDEMLRINAKDFLDEITTNNKLKAVLSGSNFLFAGNSETTPLYVHALSLNSYINSSWRVIKGGSQISKILIKKLRDLGADLFKHQEIIGFKTENSKIVSCFSKTNNYYGSSFISNINIKQTIQLIGEEKFGKPFTKRLKSLEVVPSVFTVYLVLKPNTIPYFNNNIYHFKNEDSVWDSYNQKGDNWPNFAVLTTNLKEPNQKYCDTLTLMTYMNFEEVKQWEDTFNTVKNEKSRGEDYERFKTERTEKLLAFIENRFPEIKDNYISIHASSPLSYRDYIGCERGNLYGFVKDSESPMRTMISAKTKVENLFLTGQNVRMHGVLGVTVSAFVTASEMLGKDYLLNKISAKVNV